MKTHEETSRSRLFLGLILIVVGTAYSLDELGYVDASQLWSYAPLVLVVIGGSKMMSPISSTGRLIGLMIALVGSFLLAGNLGWTDLGFWNLWPLVPVLAGLRLIFGPQQDLTMDSFHTASSFVMMGGLVRSNNSAHFRGGDLVAFMGGVDFDLRSARISENPAVVDAVAFWGGIDIKVPEDWVVKIEGLPLLGAFEDERPKVDEAALPAGAVRQELVVKGVAVMGGVGISS